VISSPGSDDHPNEVSQVGEMEGKPQRSNGRRTRRKGG